MTDLNKQEFITLEILKSMLGNVDPYRGDAETCLKRAIDMSKTIIKECNETQDKTD